MNSRSYMPSDSNLRTTMILPERFGAQGSIHPERFKGSKLTVILRLFLLIFSCSMCSIPETHVVQNSVDSGAFIWTEVLYPR